ncbi:tetratricopeptide repeat protein [bacterium]|nr:tetratricopeptide repeat protein [bacterium]
MNKSFKQLLYLAAALTAAGACFTPTSAFGVDKSRVKIHKQTSLIKAPQPGSSEVYSAEKAGVLSQKRRALIEDIKRFIRDARDNEQVAELNLRLGGLYMEDYYASAAKAQQEYDTALAAWEKNKRGRQPQLDTTESKTSMTKARALYKDLLKRAPNHPRRDEVLYFLAVSSMDEGNVTAGLQYLERIVRELPNSKYYADALVQLADQAFDKNQFPKAEQLYDKLIERKHVPLLAYANYKKAWCAYNRQSYAESAKLFRWVVGYADSDGDGSAMRIRAEALRDITLPFAETKSTSEAVEFFKGQSAQDMRQGLENMASIYYEKGVPAEAIRLYDYLIALDQNFSKNPDYDLRAIESLKALNREEDAVARLFERMPNYLNGSNWYELNASNPATVQSAATAYEELTRNYALRYHATAQKMRNEALYNRAKAIYTKYVEYFPRTEHTAKVRFFLAEILYKQAQYLAASEHYYRVYQDPGAGKLRLEAIRAALSALDLVINAERKKAGLAEINSKNTAKLAAKDDESLALIAYSQVETRFLEIGEEYLKAFPGEKDAPDVLYEQSYLRYTHHDFPEAFKGFWALIQKHPKHATATSSAHLLLDILNRRKEYAKLVAACVKFLEMRDLHRGSFKADISDILRKAELKRIALLEEGSQFKAAAEGYVEYTKTYGPQDEALFEKALYNAAVNYTKAGMLLPAVETQERFLRRFPKSGLRENMLLQVAKTFESLAKFDKAGQYFEEFAKTYAQNPQSKNALRLAGLYLGGSGHLDRAEAILLRFIAQYPADTKMVERDLLSLYEANNAIDRQINYHLRARSVKGTSAAEYLDHTLRAVELATEKNSKIPTNLLEEARKIAERYGSDLRRNPQGAEALAKLRFWSVSSRDVLFQSYKLALPQSQLEANLKRKLMLLQELEQEYGKIAAIGNAEWGLGALYRTATAYRHMAQSVLTAPVPAELNSDQLDGYRAELKRQMIDPFNEKARSLAANCLDKAQEFNVLSEWTSRCYQLASEMDSQRYPAVRTFYLPPMMLSVAMPAKESKTEIGNMKRFQYPFFSSLLFAPNRQLASLTPFATPQIYDRVGGREDSAVTPSPISYDGLADERRGVLKHQYDSEKPEDVRKNASFSFLNVMRVVSSSRAIPLIEAAILKDPKNMALVNLLGLAHLESGKIQAANTCWLSLVARGYGTAAVWNNLGVAAGRAGNEAQAIAYFQEALKQPAPKETLVNMGFVALRYRNGFEAKSFFKKALKLDEDDVPAQVGLAVAQVQSREMDDAKDQLVDLSRRYAKDPYARLSLGYYLVDVERETALAQKLVTEFMNSQSMENDMTFRQLLMEARNKPDSGEEENDLPGIE